VFPLDRIKVCTSIDRNGYETYGKDFFASFKDYWPCDLVVFANGCSLDYDWCSRIELNTDYDLQQFLKTHWPNAGNHGLRVRSDGSMYIDYRFQAIKFCYKAFAVSSRNRPDCDWWIWLDADTVTKKKIDAEFFDSVLDENCVASYLGRKDWDHSECGFVAYNMLNGGKEFLSEFRDRYTSGRVFNLSQWHDSYVFDRIMDRFLDRGYKFKNLSEGISGLNVWPETILGSYIDHNKGPIAKRKLYNAAAT